MTNGLLRFLRGGAVALFTSLAVLLGFAISPAHAEVVELAGKALGEHSRLELARTRTVMPQASEFPFAYLVQDIVSMGRSCWQNQGFLAGTKAVSKASAASQYDVAPADSEAEDYYWPVAAQASDEQIVAWAMAKTEVAHLADREVTRLSSGEKGRVTLARVLAQQAKIVFLDEPTAALDIAHQEKTMEICLGLAKAGVGVVAVMHDIHLAAAYCDRIALMAGGSIEAFGAPVEVLPGPRLSKVYDYPIDVAVLPSDELVVLPRRAHARRPGGVNCPAGFG